MSVVLRWWARTSRLLGLCGPLLMFKAALRIICDETGRCVLKTLGLALGLLIAVVGGGYCGLMVSHVLINRPNAWQLANDLLTTRAWVRAAMTPITTADATFLDSVADRTPAQLHIAIVLAKQHKHTASWRPAPHTVLNAAQRCSIEAALRVAPTVRVWIAGVSQAPDSGAWRRWRDGLMRASDGASLGNLVVRLHRFNASLAIGAWLRGRGASIVYRQGEWDALGIPSYPAIVSDLVRLDVLDTHGGVYLDADVIPLDATLSRLDDGFALQVYPLRHSPVTRTHLYESCNGAVLVSRSAGGRVPRAIAEAALSSWHRWNDSRSPVRLGEWGIVGPRATSEAWVSGVLSAARGRLYAPETFGYMTCGATAADRSCAEFSTSNLPIDDARTTDAEWQAFKAGRLAQHGIKSLLPPPSKGLCSDTTRRWCVQRRHPCTHL
jgi:hypothetical protein